MKAYSIDVRERVLQAVDNGYPQTEIIKLFGVSRATIKRYLKQGRETGDINVRPLPGRPSKIFAPLQAGLHFEGMGESMIIERSANAAAFEQYVEEILALSLSLLKTFLRRA